MTSMTSFDLSSVYPSPNIAPPTGITCITYSFIDPLTNSAFIFPSYIDSSSYPLL